MSVVDEVCARVPELANDRAAIVCINDALIAKGFVLSVRYESAQSETAWESRLVRLAVNNGWGGRSVLWDLLHELGHVLDGRPPRQGPVRTREEAEEQKRRELQAWALAETFLEAHLRDLLEHVDEFRVRKEFCLRTHGAIPMERSPSR